MGTGSETRVAVVAGWLRRLKERYVDPEDVDDGEELTLDVVEHVSEHLEALEAVLRGEECPVAGVEDRVAELELLLQQANDLRESAHRCEQNMAERVQKAESVNAGLLEYFKRAELFGSRARARLKGLPEPEGRDWDFIVFTDDPALRESLRATLASLGEVRENESEFWVTTAAGDHLNIMPAAKRRELLAAYRRQDETGCPKSEMIEILTLVRHQRERADRAERERGVLIALCGKTTDGADCSFEDAEVVIRNAVKMMVARLGEKGDAMRRYVSEDPGAIPEDLLEEVTKVMTTALTDPEKRDCLPLRALEAFKGAQLTSDSPVGQLIEHLAINVGWWVMEQQGVGVVECERDEARAKVADLEGLYAAAVKRLQDLGETEVPLGSGAAEEAGGELRRGDVVEVVKRLSTYHQVGSRVAVTHVSERGDFKLATGDARMPEKSYGFAYRPHVEIVRRKSTG